MAANRTPAWANRLLTTGNRERKYSSANSFHIISLYQEEMNMQNWKTCKNLLFTF